MKKPKKYKWAEWIPAATTAASLVKIRNKKLVVHKIKIQNTVIDRTVNRVIALIPLWTRPNCLAP